MFDIDSAGEAILPRNSFAIQIKSSGGRNINADNKIDYLNHLELPFFVGVVSRSPVELRIYTAAMLPFLIEHKGVPKRLSLKLVPECGLDEYCRPARRGGFELRCPFVETLTGDEDRSTLAAKVEKLSRVCRRARTNIASRISQEQVYEIDDAGQIQILAGPGSAQVFRANFLKRLAEVFANLRWAFKRDPAGISDVEISTYESLYRSLQGIGPLPDYVVKAHDLFWAAKLIKESR
jgi:hypothetical protein